MIRPTSIRKRKLMDTTAKVEIRDVNLASNDHNLRTLRDDELDLVNGGTLGVLVNAANAAARFAAWYGEHVLDCPLPGGDVC
jgi:hypothetical protein